MKIQPSKEIKFSKSYKKKINLRNAIQRDILEKINNQEITDDAGLQEYLSDLQNSIDAIKSTKFDTYQKAGFFWK